MAKKSINLPDKIIENINNYHTNRDEKNFTGKLHSLVEDVVAMSRFAKLELVDYFSLKEAELICDVFNGCIYTVNINPVTYLYINVRDGIILDRSNEKWGVDKETILGKIEKLTSFQAHCVISMTISFWEKDEINDIKERIEKIFPFGKKED